LKIEKSNVYLYSNKFKMKKVLIFLSAVVVMSSCTTPRGSMVQGGNHIQMSLDHRPDRIRRRDVEVIRFVHGNYGNIFHRREQPCSNQW
jgi:hypothetical protein